MSLERLLTLLCRASVIGCALALGGLLAAHRWLWDGAGKLVAGDFVDVWAAGQMARAGQAASVYDWPTHKAAEAAAVGHGFDGYYGWHYPPPFLFVADALGALPYVVAELVWVTATLILFALVAQRIAQRTETWVMACAFPASVLNFAVGQNGFFTAALVGLFLLHFEKRPLLSGLFLGLLTYKPQFGIVIPFVLLACGAWRVMASAAVTAIAMIVLSWLTFGGETWTAFLHSIAVTNREILDKGLADFHKLQTVFGAAMSLGASHWLAWALQGAAALTATVLNAVLWRDARVSFAEKAAALVAGILFATPYLYIYDYPVLFVAIAFVLRDGLRDRTEGALLLASVTPSLLFAFFDPLPTGPLGALMIVTLVARRRLTSAAATASSHPSPCR